MNIKRVVIVGLKSVGKSTVAKLLAEQLSLPLIDIDTVIENNYFKETGKCKTFQAIYQKIGQTAFRELERKVVAEVVEKPKGIIAMGGSTLLNERNYQAVQHSNIHIIYLQASYGLLLKRWQQAPPSFVSVDTLEEDLTVYYQKRAGYYADIANTIIDVNADSAERIAERIMLKITTKD